MRKVKWGKGMETLRTREADDREEARAMSKGP